MRGLSLIEKTSIIASSILLVPAILIATSITQGMIPPHIIGAVALVPPIAMYVITDLIKAVKIFISDL